MVKPGSDWSLDELDFFKIIVQSETDFASFFNEDPTDPESLRPAIREMLSVELSGSILETMDWSAIVHKHTSRFIKYVLAVTKTHMNMESTVDDLAKTLLESFEYDEGDLAIFTREELQLDMCRSKTSAKPDICIENSMTTVKLLVQEDKSYKTFASADPEAQVIAEAIAAFQENNRVRRRTGLDLLKSQLIPCITMMGTYPVFYLFEVTLELAESVRAGSEPLNTTLIRCYRIPRKSIPLPDIMLDRVARIHIFQCYSSFKKFITG